MGKSIMLIHVMCCIFVLLICQGIAAGEQIIH